MQSRTAGSVAESEFVDEGVPNIPIRSFDETGHGHELQLAGLYDNPDNIQSVEVKAKSYDGTLVPLSITYQKAIQLDGSSPTWLQGYGAYGSSYPPFLEPTILAWFENGGGVHAVCRARGGGEYGEEWQLASKKGRVSFQQQLPNC